jgi:hypothetical protein
MVFSSSKRRSTGARISFTGGPSEVLFVAQGFPSLVDQV